MSEFDFLNYKPDFKRDEKEKTGWIEEEDRVHVSQSDGENVHKGKELEVSNTIKDYNDFKNRFEEKVEELEKNLKDFQIKVDETTKRALEESGHESTFTPKSYRDLFKEKESSVGEYLIGVLEKEIESENGDIQWEIFTEYLEIEEELEVLDFYIKKILLPIISKEELSIKSEEEIEELEKEWIETTLDNLTKFNMGRMSYEIAMISNPDKIARRRDELHDFEKGKMLSSQEINQVDSSLMTINQKKIGLEVILNKTDRILEIEVEDKIVDDLLELRSTDKEEIESLKDTVILLKQSIDQDNKNKEELKNTRRNLYSKGKQERIIDEYSSINSLFRKNSLPSIHYMKSFQDNATEELNRVFNQSAKSIDRNHQENREKTYESFSIQISTSQTRTERLEWVKSKQESRLMFQKILNKYNETN